ncbi:MAG: hypothetical protein ACRCV9_17495 [Burkholderiaceae bacterium]
MTEERIFQIASQFEAYRDSNVPTLRGQDIVLFARQVIDEAIAGHDTGIETLTANQMQMICQRAVNKCTDLSSTFAYVIAEVERHYGIRQ